MSRPLAGIRSGAAGSAGSAHVVVGGSKRWAAACGRAAARVL